MKRVLAALYAIPLLTPALAFADDTAKDTGDSQTLPQEEATKESRDSSGFPGEFSATTTIVSDYTFRGVSQSDENAAIQGSIDYSLPITDNTAIYLGVWGSNVNFNDGDEASTEFNHYGGISYGKERFSFDIGAIYYQYPGTSGNLNYDYWEFAAAIGYDFDLIALTASVNYSPENFGETGEATYYALAATIPLPGELVLDGHIGHQTIDDNASFGLPDYTDWSVGLGHNFEGLDLKVAYVDTDLDQNECADNCDAKAVFSVSKTF